MSNTHKIYKTKRKIQGNETLLKILPTKSTTSLSEAIEAIRKTSSSKFDETLEVIFRLGIDGKKSDQNVRGIAKMPAGTGKKITVAALSENFSDISDADMQNEEAILESIKSGDIKFDILICTPAKLAKLAVHSKILGPKGLMPNPKLGTLTKDVSSAIKNAKFGQVEYRSNKDGNILAGIGKLSLSNEGLESNFKSLLDAVIRSKPATSKGIYVRSIYISSTQGLSVKLNLAVI